MNTFDKFKNRFQNLLNEVDKPKTGGDSAQTKAESSDRSAGQES